MKVDYQYVISSKKSSGHHISVSIKGTLYLSLFFLEWSSFSYFSSYISLGFTIRTVRTQNNHWGFEFNSFFQTCFPLWKTVTLSSISPNLSKHWRFLAFWLSLCFRSFLLFLVCHDTTFLFSTRAMTALGCLPNVHRDMIILCEKIGGIPLT